MRHSIPREDEDTGHGAWERQDAGQTELRLVLVGKSGSGKSATGNTILGQLAFESRLSAREPVTRRSASAAAVCGGRRLVVTDTPALFGAPRSSQYSQELTRCLLLLAPGPHALLLVTQLGRFTEEDQAAVRDIWRVFGRAAMGHTIVLFTRKEDLGDGSLHEYVTGTDNAALRALVERCGNRYCAFNNRASGAERDEQVGELLQLIQRMLDANRNAHYTNPLYSQASSRDEGDWEEKCGVLGEQVEQALEREDGARRSMSSYDMQQLAHSITWIARNPGQAFLCAWRKVVSSLRSFFG